MSRFAATAIRRAGFGPALAVIAGLALAACAGEQNTGRTVVVDGSSTVFPISEAIAEGFNELGAGSVTVGESGTGGGFQKFCRGESAVQGASRPISAAEMSTCSDAGVEYIEIPLAFDAISVVVHPSNPLTEITVEQLGKIWSPDAQNNIDNWREADPSFPDLPLTLYGPGSASGTFDYFTEAVVGKAKASRTDYTPSEDDNVLVQGVSTDRGALGYFGMAYYLANKERVRALAIKATPDAPAVYPSPEAVQSGAYTPLSRPVFLYVNAAELDRAEVRAFVDYYLENAVKYIQQVNYVPLPERAYTVARERIDQRLVGTAFGGVSDIGGNIEEVLARPLVTTAAAPTPAEPAPNASAPAAPATP